MDLTYFELQALSNFSFLRGASHPEEIVREAAALDYQGVAVTDINSFAGIVRGYFTAKELGIRYIVGTRLVIEDASLEILAYPHNRSAYGQLCALLSKGNLRAEKGTCLISIEEIVEIQKDLTFIIIPPRTMQGATSAFETVKERFYRSLSQFHAGIENKSDLFIALTYSYANIESKRIAWINECAQQFNISLVATNDILYHHPSRRALQDVLTCIREKTAVTKAGFLLQHNAERYFKSPQELKRLYRNFPEAFLNTARVAVRCQFSLEELRYEYPSEICPAEMDAHEYLRQLTFTGLAERYPEGAPEKVIALLEEEFVLIRELQYEHYFLTCYDIVRYARSIGVLCQGRGAAANSAVCYCLGITSVDPNKIELLFARFVSKARNEPPDIDIDFEHERREEVMQYIYNKYGRDRAGLVCNVITYRDRSAVREIGKALGLSLKTVDRIASLIHRWNGCLVPESDLIEQGLNPKDPVIQNCFSMTQELIEFPRHLSQHSGGFVISEKPLCETVPILNSAMDSRTIIEWNKDDLEQLGMLKIDILALGMLSCIRKALEYINKKRVGEKPFELYTIPQEDPEVYDMICKADTIGVFQIESRAQMSMLPRLRPRCFYDLIIEVAIVRPGPIHGDMVHPYLKRRAGLEKVVFPDKKFEEILGKTLGVPLFQEQAMRLAIVVGGFTPEEADRFRRAIASWKRNKKVIAQFQERIMSGMLANGYSVEMASACIEQMKGFSEYGFPESHAASFAHLVYASSWIKKHYPAEFAAAIINSQPMGFYSTSELVRDALHHDITVKPVDILQSGWDCFVDESNSLRLGLKIIKGLKEKQIEIISTIRNLFEIRTIKELFSLAHYMGLVLRRDTLAAIARADGFQSMGLNPREALWIIKGLPIHTGPLDPRLDEHSPPKLPLMTIQEAMFQDYSATGLSLKAHPMGLLRDRLRAWGVQTSTDLTTAASKASVKVAGIVTCRQRPGTAKGTVFLTLEDETGAMNLIIWPSQYDAFRTIITSSSAVIAEAHVERTAEVMHLIVSKLHSIDNWLIELKNARLPSRTHSY